MSKKAKGLAIIFMFSAHFGKYNDIMIGARGLREGIQMCLGVSVRCFAYFSGCREGIKNTKKELSNR